MSKPDPASRKKIAEQLGDSYATIRSKKNSLFTSDTIRFFSHQYVEHARYSTCDSPQLEIIQASLGDSFLDWCAWEVAYSTLNEACNNVAFVAYSYDALYHGGASDFGGKLPGFGSGYIAAPMISTLYYAHFKSCIAGLCLAGMVPSNKVFLLRNKQATSMWLPHDGHWRDSKADRWINQSQVLREYDAIRKHAQWLPERTPPLVGLKGQREQVMYHANRMGSNYFLGARQDVRTAIPQQFAFMAEIKDSLEKLLEHTTENGNYKPSKRTGGFAKRWDSAQNFWSSVENA